MRPRADVALIHPPNVYDFRERAVFYGPISDLIPSTPIFEMYPIGFLSLTTYLERLGYRVRIVNLAVRMLRDPSFDVERYLARLEAGLYAIDFHWLVHAHGAIEVARLVRRLHPDAPVLLGGLSASYYHAEVAGYPWVDFVLRGDTVEEPFAQLLETLERGGDLDRIPNLTWKSGRRIRANPLSFVPTDLDPYLIDYRVVLRSAKRSGCLEDYQPFASAAESPIGASLSAKGCPFNCVTCGGSRHAYRLICNRDRLAVKSPEALVEEMKSLAEVAKVPIFVVGDLRLGGRKRALRILELVREEIDAPLVYELFTPADRRLVELMARSSPRVFLQISPETQDESIRRAHGRPYGNDELERCIEFAVRSGIERVDLYFMLGLRGQTFDSCLGIPAYVDRLLDRIDGGGRLNAFLAPLAPFLDVGSLAFERPSEYGYAVFYRDLESYRNALTKPSWKFALNYESDAMGVDQLVDATYRVARRLVEVKVKHGILDEDQGVELEGRIEWTHRLMGAIDRIVAKYGFDSPELSRLREQVLEEVYRTSLIASKRELWPQLGGLRRILIRLRTSLGWP